MRLVSSAANPTVKLAMSLAKSSKERRASGLTVLSGVHLVQSYRQHLGHAQATLVGEQALDHAELKPLLEGVNEPIVVKQSLFTEISGLMQGGDIVEIVRTPRIDLPQMLSDDCLVLDKVQDPGNLGSILRSAAAAGVTWVVCLEGTVFAWAPKVLRAGMGAHFALKIVEGVSWKDVRKGLAIPIIATSLQGRSLFSQGDLRKPTCWVFGNEGAGVSGEILAQADQLVRIDQTEAIESLNVAASLAICLFEQRRQRLAAVP